MFKNTPDNIAKLEKNEIFVFGSNLAGRHGAGAAKLAYEKFGAIYGVGEGLQGQSYAFPTLTAGFQPRTDEALDISIGKLYQTCEQNPDKIFYLTKVGCGLAGFTEKYMKFLFRGKRPQNLIVPEGW